MESGNRHLCFLLLLSLAPLLIAPATGYDFLVGGRSGWVTNPSESYGSWSGRMRFSVNDSLVFVYDKSVDSVLEVSSADYAACNAANPITKLDTGRDSFKLTRSGPFYFITGNATHCQAGQRLLVVVLAIRSPPSSPTPPAPGSTPSATAPAPGSTTPPTAPAPGSTTTPTAPAPGSSTSPASAPAPASTTTPPPTSSTPAPTPSSPAPASSQSPAPSSGPSLAPSSTTSPSPAPTGGGGGTGPASPSESAPGSTTTPPGSGGSGSSSGSPPPPPPASTAATISVPAYSTFPTILAAAVLALLGGPIL